MFSDQKRLAEKIQRVASKLPKELVEKIAAKLLVGNQQYWGHFRSQVVHTISQTHVREEVEELLDYWHTEAPLVDAQSMAFGLLSAAFSEEYHREALTLEPVWTGPISRIIPLRRTDQALLQLINESKHRLLIISFAIYNAQNIVDALIIAAKRKVAVTILAESPEESAGKLAYDAIAAMGPEIQKHADIYIWPLEERPLSPDKKHGSLHAKAAVADGRSLFITSANLTHYAMTLNMELGVLIRGGLLPRQVERHFEALMQRGILERWEGKK